MGLTEEYVGGHITLCQALRKQGDIDGAIAVAEVAVRRRPRDATAHGCHGFALLAKKGQLDAAIAAFERSIALDPEDESSQFHLGNALVKKGRLADAIAAFQRAIRLKPNHAEAHTNLGNAYWRNRQADEALAAYRIAIFLGTGGSEPHYNLGIVLGARGQGKNAVAAFEEAIRLNPDAVSAYNHLGMALLHDKQVPAAIATYRRGIERGATLAARFPKDAGHQGALGALLHNLAVQLIGLKELTEAKQMVMRAIDHQRAAIACDPENPGQREFLRNHYAVLAECSQRLGDHAAAARAAAELPGVFPNGWEEYRRGADFLAQCVRTVERDAALDPEQRLSLAEKYGAQAVAMLRQAVGKGFKNAQELRTDADLAPLQSRTDFQTLIRELETTQKPPTGVAPKKP